MIPRGASVSGFHHSDPFREGDDSCTGDSDPFWGYGAEQENASVSTSRWGGVSVVGLAAQESPSVLYSPEYDSSPLSFTHLSPRSLFDETANSATGAAASPADIGQLLVSEGLSSSEPAQQSPPKQSPPKQSPQKQSPQKRSPQKRPRGVEQEVALPASKKPVNRMVQIDGFSWVLPPDPGEGGPYPSLTFLIGAAISASNSGRMALAGIRQWIRARYPSRSIAASTVSSMLVKRTEFVNIRAGTRSKGLWRLRNPHQFRCYYEKGIFLKRRPGTTLERSLWQKRSASEQGQGAASSARLVKFGTRILILPPYSEDHKAPSLKLLCGCAIALGSEQGSSVRDITEWITGYYSVQAVDTIKEIKDKICSTLNIYGNDFQCTDTHTPGISKMEPASVRWMLKNSADFATNYEKSGWEDGTVVGDSSHSSTVPPASLEMPPASLEMPPASLEMPPASLKKPADRTAQIAGFSWTLPPDPGEGGEYPSIIFLIGAALSSSDSGMMKQAEIRKWIRARFPSREMLTRNSISGLLTRMTDFISVRSGKQSRTGMWKLRNPEEFRSYYEKDIYLRHRCGVAYRDWALRGARSVPAQEGSGAASPRSGLSLSSQSMPPGTDGAAYFAPALSVKIEGYKLTLPAYSAGQKRPPLRLLCGCAIVLGPEQGANVAEIAEWIAGRYFVRDKKARKKLNNDVSRALYLNRNDFKRADIHQPRSDVGRNRIRWRLVSPTDFAILYGGYICSQYS